MSPSRRRAAWRGARLGIPRTRPWRLATAVRGLVSRRAGETPKKHPRCLTPGCRTFWPLCSYTSRPLRSLCSFVLKIRATIPHAHYPSGAMFGRRASRLAPYRHYTRNIRTRIIRTARCVAWHPAPLATPRRFGAVMPRHRPPGLPARAAPLATPRRFGAVMPRHRPPGLPARALPPLPTRMTRAARCLTATAPWGFPTARGGSPPRRGATSRYRSI